MCEIGPPLRRAFAHNDYRQRRPLLDALEHGFAAVEADVFLVDGELLVGHGRRDVEPGRTLSSVYLDPLAEQVKEHGQVYEGQSFLLLVDTKSDAGPTYAALHEVLSGYKEMLTHYRYDGTLSGPVRVVVSGHTDLPQMEKQLIRYATADVRLPHLEKALSPVVSMVSDRWAEHFRWLWLAERWMRRRQQAKIARLVGRIHDAGCEARFWGVLPRSWPALLAADVDHIITDDLAGLREFLLANDP
jgi:glycerophosphoryl diester phosphodiesterase